MAEICWSIEIEPLPGGEPSAPADVLRALFEQLADHCEDLCSSVYSGFVLDDYCVEQMEASLSRLDEQPDTHRLEFVFSDRDNRIPLAMRTLDHWFRWAFALEQEAYLGLLREHGYALRAPYPSIQSLLRRGPELPIVYFDLRAFGVPRREGMAPLAEDAIWVEETVRRADWPPLSAYYPEEQRAIQGIAVTGRCACEICQAATASAGDPSLADTRDLDDNLPRAWARLHEDAGLHALAEEARRVVIALDDEAWSAAPEGPGALRSLSDRLAREGLPVSGLALTRMLLNLSRPG